MLALIASLQHLKHCQVEGEPNPDHKGQPAGSAQSGQGVNSKKHVTASRVTYICLTVCRIFASEVCLMIAVFKTSAKGAQRAEQGWLLALLLVNKFFDLRKSISWGAKMASKRLQSLLNTICANIKSAANEKAPGRGAGGVEGA